MGLMQIIIAPTKIVESLCVHNGSRCIDHRGLAEIQFVRFENWIVDWMVTSLIVFGLMCCQLVCMHEFSIT